MQELDLAKQYFDKLYQITKDTYDEHHHFMAYPITSLGEYYSNIGNLKAGLEQAQKAYNILADKLGTEDKLTLWAQLKVCNAQINLGEFDEAELVLDGLSKKIERKFGERSIYYSNIIQMQATLYSNKGEFKEAIRYISDDIKMTEEIYGKHHIRTLSNYHQLSQLHAELGDLEKAFEYNDISIEIATSFYGKDKATVMPFLLQKANLYQYKSRYKESREIYDKIKTVYMATYGDSCKQLIGILQPEARLLVIEGYGEKAVSNLEGLKELKLSICGENSIFMCDMYNCLAEAYTHAMQYETAREYYLKSLDIAQKELGKNNMRCINILVGLGDIHAGEARSTQHLNDARQFYNSAKNISISVYGQNSLITANIESKLGHLSLKANDLQDAYRRFTTYANTISKLYPDDKKNLKMADVNFCMGSYHMAKANESLIMRQDTVASKEYARQALEQFNSAKDINITVLGDNNIGTANIMNLISQAYLFMQQPDSAIAVSRGSAEMQLKIYGKDSPLAARAYAMLGNTYVNEICQTIEIYNENLKKASEYYQKAISTRHDAPGNTKETLIASTLEWRFTLSAVYAKLQDYDNAFKTIDDVILDLEELQIENKWGCYNAYYCKADMLFSYCMVNVPKNEDGTLKDKEKAEEAIRTLQKAKELIPVLNFTNTFHKENIKSQLHFAFGNTYKILNNREKAIEHLEKTYDHFSRYQNPQTESIRQSIEEYINENKEKCLE